MPRSKGSEMPQQRQSPRAPLHLKTTSSAESNGVHRPVRDRSPKLEDHRRSPRSPLPEVGVCNQKKRGTRVSDLETRLGHAKEELKKLKEQLASAENAKRNAQQELEDTKKLIPVTQAQQELGQEEEQSGGVVEEVINPVEQEVEEPPVQQQESPIPVASVDSVVDGGVVAVEDAKEEVIAEVVLEEEVGEIINNEVKVEETSNDRPTEVVAVVAVSDPNECKQEEEEPSVVEKTADEILVVEVMPAKEDSEIERYIAENAALKKELEEVKAVVVGAAKTKEEEMVLKVRSLTEKLEVSRVKSDQLEEQLEAVETAKAQLETEMKRLRIQTDQWRKAADTAAAIISADGGMGMDPNGNGGGQRSGSMDKQLGGSMGCETSGNGYVGSPLMGGELDEGMGNGKRKSAGIRMFGELWKKKGHQK